MSFLLPAPVADASAVGEIEKAALAHPAAASRILIRILREVALPAVIVDKWGVRD